MAQRIEWPKALLVRPRNQHILSPKLREINVLDGKNRANDNLDGHVNVCYADDLGKQKISEIFDINLQIFGAVRAEKGTIY